MKGYIGFFDILGYQNFLKNNTDEAVQKDVLGFISSIENPSPDLYVQVFPRMTDAEVKIIVKTAFDRIKWLVFSDTIVFTLEPGSEHEIIYYFIVLSLGRHLTGKMFEYGLPLRGALHFGEYQFTGHSMAGRGIVDAYEASGDINLSTCVLTNAMEKRFEDLRGEDKGSRELFESLVCKYATPLSGGKREMLYNLKSENISSVKATDIREFVHRKFWAHNKYFTDMRVVEKVDETERFFMFCSMKDKA